MLSKKLPFLKLRIFKGKEGCTILAVTYLSGMSGIDLETPSYMRWMLLKN